jgi:hypothetical protein
LVAGNGVAGDPITLDRHGRISLLQHAKTLEGGTKIFEFSEHLVEGKLDRMPVLEKPAGLSLGADGTLYVVDAQRHVHNRIKPLKAASTGASPGTIRNGT